MKIVLITRVWPTQRAGGMAHVCYDRAVELAKSHEVHVITTSFSTNSGIRETYFTRVEESVTVHYTPTPSHQWSREFTVQVCALVEKLQPDIAHSDSFDREWPWIVDLKFRPKRIAITMHGFELGGWLTKWNEHRVLGTDLPPFPEKAIHTEIEGLRHADTVIGVSKWEWRMMADQYGLSCPQLVYNPIHPAFFENLPLVKEREGFLCAAISQGSKRGFTFAEQAAKMAGKKLVVANNVPREQMPMLYDRVEAVVLPTFFCQGYDLTIAEARARGVPAIMTPTGSYLDEAMPWDALVRMGSYSHLAEIMREWKPLEAKVHPFAALDHEPIQHAHNWLEAVCADRTADFVPR